MTRAAQSIRDALDRPLRVPSKERPPNSGLQRAPLLEAQVEIEIAANDLARARSAADELSAIAERFHSKALVASAELARGRVRFAEGDVTDARQRFSTAARLWNEVGAPYEAALSRLGLAECHRASGNEHQAELEAQAAEGILRGTEHPHGRSSIVVPPGEHVAATGPVPADPSTFRCDGDYWTVAFDGVTVAIRDRKGMRHVARLLADPGRELHVLDLVALDADGSARSAHGGSDHPVGAALGDSGHVLDDQAKAAYRRRLAEIDDDIEIAVADGDAERATQASYEREFLVRELSRAFGVGGRDRRAGSASERARVAVTRAIRQAMARIEEHHPLLGAHLSRAIRTGTYCAYLPDPRLEAVWDVANPKDRSRG